MDNPRLSPLLAEAIREFSERGYTSEADLHDWLLRLAAAIEREVPTDAELRRALSFALDRVFAKGTKLRTLAQYVPVVTRYGVDRVQPTLRAELDRRIFAGIELIKLNKRTATQRTLQRFSGWVSSMPAGGSPVKIRELAQEITKPLRQIKYEARRVAIDQGHKLNAAVAHVVAKGNGAVAAIWHDRGQNDHSYDARPAHLARSGKLFLIRGSWAQDDGLVMRRGGVQYTDEIEQPAEMVFCSCYYEYVTSPRALPDDVLTVKGRLWVEQGVGRPRAVHDAVPTPIRKEPTPAQLEAGNYPKGHVRFGGLDVTIETSSGETRRGVGADGKPWATVMPADYGYIRRTIGADDEQIDCYVGPNQDAARVWVVQQQGVGSPLFDEQKVLLGFNSRSVAIETYKHGFSDGVGQIRIGDVLEMSVAEFKRQIDAGSRLLIAM